MTIREAFGKHWPEYLMEAWGLGMFMVSAGIFTCLLESPASPLLPAIPDPDIRRALIGLAMGLTAISIIYSPWGQRSGAHLNPSVTLAFLRLGKVKPVDAMFYILAHFVGGTLGVLAMVWLLGMPFTDPPVSYITTVPGITGKSVAFGAEFLISTLLMLTVLRVSNSKRYARYTGLCAGSLVFLFITFEAPYSGMSMNPARSFATASIAAKWKDIWIYCTAPVLGMQAATLFYRLFWPKHLVHCAKLDHSKRVRCIHCGYESKK
jgi:aquaporin Z